MVTAQQQQLSADSPFNFPSLLRQQPQAFSQELLSEKQAICLEAQE
jgi:hypothetical protein